MADEQGPKPLANQPATPDPRYNLFWMFVSFMGISIPKPGQERRAMTLIITAMIPFLLFVTLGVLTLFKLW
jgi:hypothetical protein